MISPTGFAVVLIGLGAAVGLAPRQRPTPTYHAEIAPMIERSCVPCHRPESVAPFSLQAFADVKRRASLIQYQVLSQAMPPHRVRSDVGALTQTPPLSDAETVRLQEWIRAGAPEGERIPRGSDHGTKWRLGPPDVVLKSAGNVVVPAEGAPYWQLHVQPLPRNLVPRLRAFELRPVSPTVLRSASVGIATKQGMNANLRITSGDFESFANPILGSWAPGFRPWSMPAGSFVELLTDSGALVVQTHYRPRGKEEDGGFEMALYFESGTNRLPASFAALGVSNFVIEADKSLTLESATILEEDRALVSIAPFARFFASRLWVEAEMPDGTRRNLFETQRWDPYWVGSYSFANPPVLPRGTRVTARVTYDNDERCVANEGKKPQRVVSGPKVSDEVFQVHLTWAPAFRQK